MKITLIGNGIMAQSLARGLVKKFQVEIIGRDKKKLELIQEKIANVTTKVMNDNEDISDKVVIFCVKPYALQSVSVRLHGQASILISILAGTKLESLKRQIKANHYVRAMPNVAASLQLSTTTLTGDKEAKNISTDIFNEIGKTIWVNTENQLDIATAIAGSGPAYLALIAEALMDGGVKAGLERNHCTSLVQGLFQGVGGLLEKNHPAIIKDGVMSPGGTTAAGYAKLEEAGVRDAMIKAVESAFEKACELGEK